MSLNPASLSQLPAAARLRRTLRVCRALAAAVAGVVAVQAQPSAAQVQELLEQNRRLQEQVRAQQRTIDELGARMAEVMQASERHERELRGIAERVEESASPADGGGGAPRGFAGSAAEVRVGAEAGIAFFRTGRNGQFPEGEFRVDDPVITLEAPVWKDVYFFTELKLLTRETNAEEFELGELYVDFEDVLSRWGHDGLLNVRVGRLNIPFGEEYLARGPVANPLISHSLSDLWGVDEGVELYGRAGPAQYVIAVQNGGVSRLRDFHEDKAVVARVGWQPARWLHVSGSAMRTGRLSTARDTLSELWFGNGFFRALGPAATTETFWADLYQGDATVRWKGGHASAALGQANFDDSDTTADNSRRIRYGYAEVVQTIVDQLYGAARYSEIRARGGYPLAGWAPMGAFFFRPGALTDDLRRLSVGLGYRFGAPLVLKIEYAWETGRMTNGVRRDGEDFFGTELAVKF